MKIKLLDILQARPALEKLNNQDLLIQISFQVMRLIKQINAELFIFHEAKTKLASKYGTKIDGEKIKIADSKIEEYTNEYNILMDELIDLDFSPIDLLNVENAKITPNELGGLEPFLKKPEEESNESSMR